MASTAPASTPTFPKTSLPILPHLTFNDTSSNDTTVVLLHGLSSSPLEYAYVHPHLPTYHLLIPYLPSHGQASEITPFTLPHAASLIAHLITTHARNRRAHVVGLSVGGFVGVHLTAHHPEVVQTLFATGVSDLASRPWVLATLPYVIPSVEWVHHSLPDSMYNWVQKKLLGTKMPDGLKDDVRGNLGRQMLKSAFASIGRDGKAVPLSVRALIVAGGKQDSVEGTREYGKVVREGNGESRACVVRTAMHAWSLQLPELFAEGVKCWIGGRELPKEFEQL